MENIKAINCSKLFIEEFYMWQKAVMLLYQKCVEEMQQYVLMILLDGVW